MDKIYKAISDFMEDKTVDYRDKYEGTEMLIEKVRKTLGKTRKQKEAKR